MIFNTFCNICFIKENIIKLCEEENEHMLNILISFTSCPDIVNGTIYLCINCCKKLEEYDKFRELYLTNFVRFRYLYNEHKKRLKLLNDPDREKQLKNYVDINVNRQSGTPLIENYEYIGNATESSKNSTDSDVDITCTESDAKFSEIDLAKLLQENNLTCADASCVPENTSENETQNCHVNYENDAFIEDGENIDASNAIQKSESLLCEANKECENKESVDTSISYPSSTNDESCSSLSDQTHSTIEDNKFKKDEPNSGRIEEAHDKVVSDTVTNLIPCRKSADESSSDRSDLSTKTKKCVTENSLEEKGPTHEENDAKKSYVICYLCDGKFTSKRNLRNHMFLHTGESPYSCDECQKKFRSTSNLKRHKLIHTGEKPFKCDKCDMGFLDNRSLNTHKFKHTDERPLTCDVCQKTFTIRNNLARHKHVHNSIKRFICEVCGSGFNQSTQFKLHKLSHTDERPYSCDECHKTFTNSISLRKHKRIHNNEKRFKCDECDAGFNENFYLKRHKARHSSEKPYSCIVCKRTFSDTNGLKKHQVVHTGEKRHKCDECGMRFTQLRYLISHTRIHTGERPYPCDECGKAYSDFNVLKRHKLIHTGNKTVI